LAEEKKGRIRITINIEMDDQIMEVLKDVMANMPKLMSSSRK
jgi:hypothetical protein